MCHAFFILSIIFVRKGGLFMARSSKLESGFQDRLNFFLTVVDPVVFACAKKCVLALKV